MGAYARGAPVRILGATMTGVNDQYWYAKADAPINSGKDLAGRTVSYSTSGASTHAVVLGFKRTFGVEFNAVATGGQPATLTQVLSGQIDVGWAAAPFAFKELEAGRIKIVARANEVPELRQQSVRVMAVNVNNLAAKRDLIMRYLRGYRDTVEWMYTSDEAVERYAKIVGSTVEQARKVRAEFIKKEDIMPDRVAGLDLLMKDAIAFKFLSAPLSDEQLRDLVVKVDR
jgi:NitT/TauT family transport system substrate-binding protein